MRVHGAYQKAAVTEPSMAQRLEVEKGYRKDLIDTSLTPRTFAETLDGGPWAEGSAHFICEGPDEYFRLCGSYTDSVLHLSLGL